MVASAAIFLSGKVELSRAYSVMRLGSIGATMAVCSLSHATGVYPGCAL